MKKYRDCLADTYALSEVLEYVSRQADYHEAEMERYVNLSRECDGTDDYYSEQAEEHRAKAAALERLLAKLTK